MQPVKFQSVEHTVDPDIFTSSAEYDLRFAGPVGEFFLATQRGAVLKLLRRCGSGPLKILELGGGHLQMTEELLKLGHEVTVHSSRAEGLAKLEQMPFRKQVRTAVVPLSKLAMFDEQFDVLIALRLVPHVQDIRSLFVEISRLTKRALIIDYAAARGFNALSPYLFQMKRKIEKNTRPYFSHAPREMELNLRTAGFPEVEKVPQFFFPMGLHRKLNSAPLSTGIERASRALGLTRLVGSPVVVGAYR